jgi:hypothetical protein
MTTIKCECGAQVVIAESWSVWTCGACQRPMVRGVRIDAVPAIVSAPAPPPQSMTNPMEFVKCRIPPCRREAISAGGFCAKHGELL